MAAQLRPGAELRTSMWKFDVLRSDQLNQTAVEDAVEADVIIVANARNSGLSDPSRPGSTAGSPRKRGQSAALVALSTSPRGSSRPPPGRNPFSRPPPPGADGISPQEIRLPFGSLSPASITASVELPRHRQAPPVVGTPGSRAGESTTEFGFLVLVPRPAPVIRWSLARKKRLLFGKQGEVRGARGCELPWVEAGSIHNAVSRPRQR